MNRNLWIFSLVLVIITLHVELPGRDSLEDALEDQVDHQPIPGENDLIFVKGGWFDRGSNSGNSDEKPVGLVYVDDFYLGKYEVTQQEYRLIMGVNPSAFQGDELPVEQISWFDAVEFCNKLSLKEGLTPCYSRSGEEVICDFQADGYRLPTEAEWEYAARCGNESENPNSRLYSGFNTIGDVAWYDGNSGRKTHPVGTKQANELGIHDMSGNVWEWCNDWYDSEYYGSSTNLNPEGPQTGTFRTVRGSCWNSKASYLRITLRNGSNPYYKVNTIGFRYLKTP